MSMSFSETHNFNFSVCHRMVVAFTNEAFKRGNDQLAQLMPNDDGRPARALVVIDEGVVQADTKLIDQIHHWFADQNQQLIQLAAAPEIIVGGEAAKEDLSLITHLGQLCQSLGICRHSYMIIIGGGATLDAVGLAATLIHRGIRQIRMPTTVLAQDDAGLGVKNGINAFGCKNFLGTFSVPWAILNDRYFLTLLSERHWRSGIAEAFKVAIIKDESFLRWLITHGYLLRQRDLDTMGELIRRCGLLHLEQITQGGDPFETGNSRPLDFGHWSAHRMEVLSKHRLSHGEAVAIGMSIDLLYAVRIKRIDPHLVDLILDALEECGFSLWDHVLDMRDSKGHRSVWNGLEQFREHLGGSLCIAMPDGAGCRCDIDEYDEEIFEAALTQLKSRRPQSQHFLQQ